MLLRPAPLRAERNRKLRSQVSGWPSPNNWNDFGAVELALRFCSLRAPFVAIEVQVSSWPSPDYRSDVGAVEFSGAVELSFMSWSMKIQAGRQSTGVGAVGFPAQSKVSSWPQVNWCRCRWNYSAKQSLTYTYTRVHLHM